MGSFLCRPEHDALRRCLADREPCADTAQALARWHGTESAATVAGLLRENAAGMVTLGTTVFGLLAHRTDTDGSLTVTDHTQVEDFAAALPGATFIMLRFVPLEPASAGRFLIHVVGTMALVNAVATRSLVTSNESCVCVETNGLLAVRPLDPSDLRFVWSLGLDANQWDNTTLPGVCACLAHLWNHRGEDATTGAARLCVGTDDARRLCVSEVGTAEFHPRLLTFLFLPLAAVLSGP